MTKITKRTRTTTLNKIAGEIAAAMSVDAGRARVRRLDLSDMRLALDHHKAMVKAATDEDEAVSTTAWGGFVANGYNKGFGGATADRMVITTVLATGETTWRVERATGCNRSGGRGNWLFSNLRKSGQCQGRMVVA